jgi:hypothetical protein
MMTHPPAGARRHAALGLVRAARRLRQTVEKRMRHLWLVLSVLWGFAPAASAGTGTDGVIVREVYAQASVGADGRVTALEFDAGTPAPIEGAAKPALLALAFEPATRGGDAVPSRTAVSARLRFTPDGAGGYVTEVVDVTQPLMRTHEWVHPRYPGEVARDSIGGIVWLEFEARPDGSVDPQRIRIMETRFHRDRKPYKGRLALQLIEAARVAAAQWRLFPHEVAGVAIATRHRLPMKFTPPGYGGPGQRADYDYGDFGRQDRDLPPASLDDAQRLAVLLPAGDGTRSN